MKIYNTLFVLLYLSTSVLADDTEIYGATAIDDANRINSNVLFIMDTSGSMDGKVTVTTTPSSSTGAYDNSFDYTASGSHDKDKVYITQTGPSVANGYSKTVFDSSGNGNCTDEFSDLDSAGVARSPLQGNSGDIKCKGGTWYNMYSANYMDWYHASNGTTTETTRLQVVVDVVKHLTETLSDINLGLMRFDRDGEGGMIDVPVTDIAISGEKIRDKLDTYYHSGGTPLTESLHEAALYFRGENWTYGDDSTAGVINGSGWTEISNPSAVTSMVSASSNKYQSPMESECQKNHIIMLTDGEPTNDDSSNTAIKGLIAGMDLAPLLSESCSGDGGCLDELAWWLKTTDNADEKSANPLQGTQDITLYTIGGFNLTKGVDLLTRAANYGGGRYYPADDTQGLVDALDAIFLDILATDSTFTAPAVSVNAFNASEHRDELFYALFKPADNIKWSGNLKKYKLLKDGLVVGVDQSIPAVSESTGFFNESIFDYWNITSTPDGKNVELGGMANKLTGTPSSRKILSNKDNSDDQTLLDYTSDATGAVANKTSFGISDDSKFTEVHDWSMGMDVLDANGNGDKTDSRQSIGDPLHSEPLIITYGGTETNPISSIFFGTNEGFIHSLDTETGLENFAFIPNELHSIQEDYFDNVTAAADKPYGMDGAITTWFYDKNSNNVILDDSNALESGEYAYIYAGMRRGGNNYYALDVSNRLNPTMKFMIEGGVGKFTKLGQTWSKMTIAKVKFKGVPRFVAFFTGGYDPGQDGYNVRTNDTTGNAIYMVDASTGERLWWTSNTGADLNISTMVNSMPASVSAIDINGDGFTDYLFAADTGGRIFRIDLIDDITKGLTFAQGGEIADVSETSGNDATTNRRFYNKPNVSLVKDQQNGDHLTISIGSGFRAHPVSVKDVKNRFYVIKDFSPYEPPTVYESRRPASLLKTELGTAEEPDRLLIYNATHLSGLTATPDLIPSDSMDIMISGGGWYIELQNEGEKVLAESSTFSGAVIFTTFSPSSSTITTCGADTGESKVYALSQRLATATIDLDGDGDVDADDASSTLAHSGIAPRPVIIYREGGGKTIAIGTETIEDSRFTPHVDDEDCEDDGSCSESTQCVVGNCYVIPVYWRQDES